VTAVPHFDRLPNQVLADVVTQIARRLNPLVGPRLSPDAEFELTESFTVWSLSADRVRDNDDNDAPLSQLASDAHTWHHQVAVDGRPRLYARSRPQNAEVARLRVHSAVHSRIAARLNKTMIWIDANVLQVDYLVRLLVAPEYLLHAFWLVDGLDSRVVLADVCNTDLLVLNRLYRDAEFLATLRAMEPIEGIALP
jgi:hypothetical protein